jgi:hypothetical protein
VSQTVPTVSGERYIFSFYYSPRPKSSSDLFVVAVNSNTFLSIIEAGAGLTNFAWQHFTTSFVASSNLTTLAFSDTSLTGGGAGTHIDGVVLEHDPWLAIENTDSGLEVYWLGVSNEVYQLQSLTDLAVGGWTNLGAPISGNGTTNFFPVTADAPQAFYRLVIGP